MKFKLYPLAFAITAAVAANAHAADSVQLYGVVDLGIGYEQVKGPNGFKQSRIGMIDGGHGSSRFGLKGSEDLGNGLKAAFTLESGFNASNGRSGQSGRLFGRQATIGLESKSWGTLRACVNENYATAWIGDVVNPFGTNFGTAGSGSSFSSAASVRFDNLIAYETPKMAGFQLGVGYSFNADSGSSNTGFKTGDNNRAITAGLRYSTGPVYLAAAYDSYNPSNTTGPGQRDEKLQAFILSGSYDFEVVKLGLAFGQVRDGWFKSNNMGTTPDAGDFRAFGSYRQVEGFRANSYLVALTVPMGNNELIAAWQAADPNNDKLTGDDETMNIFSLGITHKLSKRTNLYAYGTYGDNYAFNRDAKNQAVAVGVRHRF